MSERPLYGMPMAVLASNNPYVLGQPNLFGDAPTKFTFVSDNPEFTKCWYEGLRAAVLRSTETHLPKGKTTWILHVVRLGFASPSADKEKCPIVLQLIVYLKIDDINEFPDSLASDLVDDLGKLIMMYWDGEEKVYVDVCGRYVFPGSSVGKVCSASGPAERCVDQSMNYARLYHDGNGRLPLPGSSIGIDGFVGTLTGYVKHRLPSGKSELFALTCRHVGDQKGNIGEGGLAKGQTITVSSPQPGDHMETKHAIAMRVQRLNQETKDLETKKKPSTTFGSIVNKIVSVIAPSNYVELFWLGAQRAAEKYKIELGPVYAASSTKTIAPDWLLVSIDPARAIRLKFLNQHFHSTEFDHGSGFKDPSARSCFSTENLIRVDWHWEEIFPTHRTLHQGPLLASDIVFKQPSRTTQKWVASKVNDIESILKPTNESDRTISQVCLVALDLKSSHRLAGTKQGDAGAMIFDGGFHPVAMISGSGLKMDANSSITNVNYLSEVYEDIEEVLGWKRGSVRWC
ncbi:uncharacterized protein BP5553_01407 [Venustampulla echinocandica]|uniref:Uncharacterized protein n=1 Tax=Venustampulla echinocandica TaxID=2656787 RepID=A0A370U0Y5_9HELO|nr:uncharacterized protein BP5553_01407 [Venustampulla echinocandica]RDL41428.1 hypothetical protein BP5553_01407 [Venustampulla echinocandica]